jgi:hypothetical protein
MVDFRSMQLSIEDLIKQSPVLSDIPVISEERQDLLIQINTALGKLGLVIIIQEVEAKVTSPNLPGPVFDAFSISVLVHENVMINRSKSDRTAKQVAKQVAEALHHKVPTGAPGPLLALGVFFQEDPRVYSQRADFKIGK